MAYCLPGDSFGFSSPKLSSIVISPRVLQLTEDNWKAIIAHELGHAIDFWLFGSRYGLKDRMKTVLAQNQLSEDFLNTVKKIDLEDDPEVRGDLLGELFLLKNKGLRLCYDMKLTIQKLVPEGTECGDENGLLLRHFPHPPLQGKYRKKKGGEKR